MKLFIRIFLILFFLLLFLGLYTHFFLPNTLQDITVIPITTFKPKISPVSFDSPEPTRRFIPTPTPDTTPWGVAQQTGEHTWTMKVGEDSVMATPSEILSALNLYRQRYGSQILTWDDKLAAYAQSRVDYFYQIGNIDSHVGFNNFLENEDGFNKLGYTYLGENISYGYRLNGVHLIEWIYAGDEPHNKNQLDSKWDHVGIAVKGSATCLIFATGKM